MTAIYVCDRCGAMSTQELAPAGPYGSFMILSEDLGKQLCQPCLAIYEGMIELERKAYTARQKLNRDAFWGRTKPVLRWNQ